MESKNINPKEELEEYELEVEKSKNIFNNIINKFKNNIKLLPSSENQNYKLTNKSVSYMWRIGEVKSHVVRFFDNLHLLASFNKTNSVKQNNIEVQIIKENNIIENISAATKKIGVLSPIIPKTKEIEKTK